MDELNEPASNFRLLQVDFYNILSPGNQLSRTDPLLSLDPLPKKSISISLEDGLQMGWAPNGYGKTFVFSNLLGLIHDHKNSDQSAIDGYHSYCERIFQKTNFRDDTNEPINPDKRHLLPFSIMGLKLESRVSKRTYSIAAVFQTATQANAAFTYEETPTFFVQPHPSLVDMDGDDEYDDHNPNRHWVASSSDSWVRIETPQGHEFLEAALDQFLSLKTEYVETPKMSMEDFTKQIQEYAHRFIGFEEHGMRGKEDSFLFHTINDSQRNIAYTIPSEFNVVMGKDGQQSNQERSSNYFSEKGVVILEALQESLFAINDFTDALNPLDSTKEFDSSHLSFVGVVDFLDEDFLDHNMIEIHTSTFLHHFAGISRDILFTIGDSNNQIRYELFCNVLQFVKEHDFLTKTWKKRLICLLETLQLAYLSDEFTCSLPFEDTKACLGALLDDIDERPNNKSYVNYRAHNIRRLQAYKEGDEEKHIESSEWIFDREQKALQQVDDSTVDMFPWALDGALVLVGGFATNTNTGLSSSFREKLDNMYWSKLNEVQRNFKERMSGGWEEVLWPKPKALGTNYRFIVDSINQIINTEDDPWGVKAKFISNLEQPIHFSPSQMPDNTLLPEFLSFGMRSEIILQCALCDFMLQHRKSRMNPEISSNFKLLILDETEVGRSEYWTQLLIKRMRRLEHQLSDFKNHSILVVSHRGLVLERSRKDGHYHVMYPLEYTEDIDI